MVSSHFRSLDLLDLEQPGPCWTLLYWTWSSLDPAILDLDTLLVITTTDSGPTRCRCCQLVPGPLITARQMFVKTEHKLSPLFIRCNILWPAATWDHHQLSQLSTDNWNTVEFLLILISSLLLLTIY